MAGEAPLRSRALAPSAVVRMAAAAFAAVLIGLGYVALSDYSARAGQDAGAAARAEDGPLRASGEVATIYEEASGPVTVIVLRGAPELPFRVNGSFSAGIPSGAYVTMEGQKSGTVVYAAAVALGTHPGAAAAPYLALGAVILAVIALDLVVPVAVVRGYTPSALVAGARVRISALSRQEGPDEEGGPGGADNHSGAPAPKG